MTWWLWTIAGTVVVLNFVLNWFATSPGSFDRAWRAIRDRLERT